MTRAEKVVKPQVRGQTTADKSGDPERVEQLSPEEWIAANGDAGPMRASTPWCREPRGFRRPTTRALSAACVGQIDIETAIAEAEKSVDPRPIGDTPGPAENSISTCGTIAQSPVTSASPEGV